MRDFKQMLKRHLTC